MLVHLFTRSTSLRVGDTRPLETARKKMPLLKTYIDVLHWVLVQQ
ncbi:unnamed protein product [Acanthoscelides obtectus]|uniref:Uncharacterized protein n=1 Tax=Acanthoscelides obtectus TaxID=200917 RepID=A0A9P0KDD7_ACAOB|nr:unnamed protein product [Acanthoscelides obtectus]CAK1647649.1 hypothetical protein AOBTE_LOCUS15318 [Acanthoscelides obtectus]